MRKVLPCILLITACSGLEDTFTGDDPPEWTCPVSLTEDRSVYQGDDGIVVMELTIEDLDGLAAVDANVDDASVAATFREGAFSAPATVKLRGQSTRLARQKSYKVKLESGAGEWRGQREINLNKHPYDLTRMRQMLAFSLFRETSELTSLRTQYVQLFINGESLGLFTHVEDPGKRFLESHGLDPEGSLYKAELFSFMPIDEATAQDAGRLNVLVEPEANGDPEKFVRMVNAINDRSQDIDQVMRTYLDRENYITWVAVNLLTGNWDTRSQNFLLYSPSGCERWYFMPWDYDGALGWDEAPRNHGRPRWKAGLSNYWGITLHERFVSKPANVDAIRARMTELRQGPFSDEKVAAVLAKYRGLVREVVSTSPDLWQLPVIRGTSEPADIMAQYDAEVERLHHVIAGFDAEFDAIRGRPMPVIMFASLSPGDMLFQWTPSLTLDGGEVTYDFTLASSPGFEPESIVMEQNNLRAPMLASPQPGSGEYFWRVVARSTVNPEENWQAPFIEAQPISLP